MNAIDVLKATRDKLEPEGAWTQGAYARDNGGEPVDYHSKRATCFCALGAINSICYSARNTQSEYMLRNRVINAFRKATDCSPIPAMNDSRHTTQLHVLMSLDFAILIAEDEAAIAGDICDSRTKSSV